MIFSKSNILALLFGGTLALAACTKGDEQPSSLYQTGVFILNEGPFGTGTGTVSYYDRDAAILKNDIYGTANGGAAIGNILQSMGLYNGQAYLMVNNANKIVVVDTKTFTQTSALTTGVILPRYFLSIDITRAYITQWGKDSATSGIAVYDYATKTIAKVIPTGTGADHIVRNTTTGAVWVLNSGGLGTDSTVAIVNSVADSILQKIKVGIRPNSMVQDANGDMWVLCEGTYQKNNGKLVKVRNNAVEYSFNLPDGASNLITNVTKDTLYFLSNNQIYSKDLLNFGANPPSVFMKPTGVTALYSLGIDPKTHFLWCGDAMDFTKSGVVHIYNLTTKTETKTLSVGVAPNGFVFQ